MQETLESSGADRPTEATEAKELVVTLRRAATLQLTRHVSFGFAPDVIFKVKSFRGKSLGTDAKAARQQWRVTAIIVNEKDPLWWTLGTDPNRDLYLPADIDIALDNIDTVQLLNK